MKNPETARRLSEALASKNMTPSELAKKSEVSKASISQYMNGTHIPSNISSSKMAKVLTVNPLWLMGFDVPKEINHSHNDYYPIERSALNIVDEFLNRYSAAGPEEKDEISRLIDVALGLDDDKMQQLINYAKFLSQEE